MGLFSGLVKSIRYATPAYDYVRLLSCQPVMEVTTRTCGHHERGPSKRQYQKPWRTREKEPELR
jgi:hypothetical protein